MFDTGIFIGRFQPLHQGHIHSLSIAASQCKKLLILIGSANQVQSIKNPFTLDQRKSMIRNKLRAAGITNYTMVGLNDHPYNDSAWINEVKIIAASIGLENSIQLPVLFGHMKEGNDYLKWFPDWKFRDIESAHIINATMIREQLFAEDSPIIDKNVRDDWKFYQREKELFKDYPFPETLSFNCGDAVATCLGKILLIQRKFAPGADCWALPGGFKNRDETFLDCAIRELQEETNIRVPEKVLRGSIVNTELFDSPKRSFGIPRNTLAVHFNIAPNPDGSLPRANGADDAAACHWFDIDYAINEMSLYDDHKGIISKMLGITPRVKLDI